ncbi:MAG: ABC transporter ATP-binding protein [Acidimicrobiales bacterium]
MLEVKGMHVSYGPVPAVRGVDLTVNAGEAIAVLGRNGAGKTTTLKAMAGVLPITAGSISIDGTDITNIPAEKRLTLGIALVPEGRGMFPQLTVRESLMMGAYHRKLSHGEARSELARVTERLPRLTERLDQASGSLSGGEQQMLAVARGLMSAPRIILVDEPSLGLAPIVIEQLYDLFVDLKAEGLTILVVEQYVELALGFADRAYVLDKGEVAVSGSASELAASPELVEAYLSAAPEEVHS